MENFQLGTKGLHVGFSKIDITPNFSVGLAGFSNAEARRTETIEERIYATCIAVTNNEDSILMFTIDSCSCPHEVAEKIRNAIYDAIGFPGDKIFCAATHSHSCPAHGSSNYSSFLLDAIVKAAKEALAR